MIKYDFKTFMNIDGASSYKEIIHKIKSKFDKRDIY